MKHPLNLSTVHLLYNTVLYSRGDWKVSSFVPEKTISYLRGVDTRHLKRIDVPLLNKGLYLGNLVLEPKKLEFREMVQAMKYAATGADFLQGSEPSKLLLYGVVLMGAL